ncbi:MAG: type II toxin-antitoxin system VapB family antitoxin [Microvirga sp.]
MALHIIDPEADRLVRELAAARGISLTGRSRLPLYPSCAAYF